MKLLFLRGGVPQDRDPKEIIYDNLDDNCDMWTHLAYELSKDGYGEIWYYGGHAGKRNHQFKDNFIERFKPHFFDRKHDFDPDVIFCRGGFPEYDQVLSRFPKAFKIYYGAGCRYLPKYKFKNYNLILVDSEKQLSHARSQYRHIDSDLLIKPAAESVLKPKEKKYKYDILFSVNAHKRKGLDFFLNNLPPDLKSVVIGSVPQKISKQFPHIDFTNQRLPRKDLPKFYSQSKVSICCSTSDDSCPRVIPESLCLDTPIAVLDSVHVWQNKYINDQTGIIKSQSEFFDGIKQMISNLDQYNPREYYLNNLSIEISANAIKEKIK